MQSLPPCRPYIRFLFVVVKESLHHFLHPSLTAFDLWFTTLGGKYLWPDFHRLAVCHARHTCVNHIERPPSDMIISLYFDMLLMIGSNSLIFSTIRFCSDNGGKGTRILIIVSVPALGIFTP